MPAVNVLRELSENPIETAAAHGKLTGRCCFCHRRLSDVRSTGMGYGPQCAESFGLDWGRAKFAFENTPAEIVQTPAQIEDDERAMQRMEAEADRQETVRDEIRKHYRRIKLEGM